MPAFLAGVLKAVAGSWFGKLLLEIVIGKLVEATRAFIKKREQQKADHAENEARAERDVEKLKDVQGKPDAGAKETDEAIDDSLGSF